MVQHAAAVARRAVRVKRTSSKTARPWSIGRVAALVVGVAGSLVAYAPLDAIFPESGAFVQRWLLFWCIGWVAILLHELGHAVAGTWLGMTIVRFYVIPLEIRLRPVSLRFTRRVFGRDLGGAVVFLNSPYASRRHRVMLSFAGPAANFATAAVLVGVAYAAPDVTPELLASMVAISVTLGIANLIPFDDSDGATIIRALRRQASVK